MSWGSDQPDVRGLRATGVRIIHRCMAAEPDAEGGGVKHPLKASHVSYAAPRGAVQVQVAAAAGWVLLIL